MDVLPIYIGYDGREHDAYEVCKASILRHATGPVFIQKLSEPALRHNGIYRREWSVENGQRIDDRDRKPFSTSFSFTRFLIPSLLQHQGWGIFVDSDFLFFKDICEIWKSLDPKYAVMCCKQNYQPKSAIKMDGQAQQAYSRKNWSSMMIFNASHASNQRLTPFKVNMEKGSWLHGLSWLDDNEIGDLDHRWNWIDGTTAGAPNAVHFTCGIPSMPGHRDQPYAKEWFDEARRIGVWNEPAA